MMKFEGSRMSEGLFQQTLKNPIHCTGVGLHSGARVSMTIRSAAVNSGIVFRRIDPRGDRAEIAARWESVTETRLCTVIGNKEGVNVGTVEHLMAALRSLAIDNALIEIDGPEVPIMDGSAAPFVFLIECAGIVQQSAARKVIRVLKRVSVGDGLRSATLSPGAGSTFSFEIDFASGAVAAQEASFALTRGGFKTEVCRARTFGFLHEVDQLRRLGLARGGSLDNAIVINGDKVMNEGGLRYHDEFVRHKILDSIGDLYLAGRPIIGHFHGRRSGHALNYNLVRALLSDPEAWALTDLSSADVVPFGLVRPMSYPPQQRLAAIA
ncbi:UDP-3-O-acyl-N-acetylglucosamine deacetylase [uncultured Gammaproteobacteria bacterium]